MAGGCRADGRSAFLHAHVCDAVRVCLREYRFLIITYFYYVRYNEKKTQNRAEQNISKRMKMKKLNKIVINDGEILIGILNQFYVKISLIIIIKAEI